MIMFNAYAHRNDEGFPYTTKVTTAAGAINPDLVVGVPVTYGYDFNRVVGHVHGASVDEVGLLVTVAIEEAHQPRVKTLLENDWELGVGAVVDRSESNPLIITKLNVKQIAIYPRFDTSKLETKELNHD